MNAYDAIVIGGGAAGIGAARQLQKAGLQKVIVLEARQRLGGRAHTSDELGCGVPLDHGAQWIHGYSLAHPMIKLAEQLDKVHTPMAGGYGTTVLSDGREVSNATDKAACAAFRGLNHQVRTVSAGLAKQPQQDCSWIQASEQMGGLPKLSPEEQAVLNLRIYKSCENYEGATLDHWSVKHGDKVTCLSGGNGDVDGGYGSLVAEAAQNLHVQFGLCVESIVYPSDDVAYETGLGLVIVRCKTSSEEDCHEVTYCAPRCVVTLPLGVLRAGHVHFEPELPACKIHAIRNLGVSLMDKVELLWKNRWWPSGVSSFEIASLDSTPTFHPWPWFYEPAPMRRHPLGWAVLVCYITGHFAEYIESLADHEAVNQCVSMLRFAFPSLEVPEPSDAYISRWGRDTFSQGSWTYFVTDSSPADARALRDPVGNRGCVAFAGEHTCDGSVQGLDMGTVHGAWLSGELAAQGLVKRLGKASGDLPLQEPARWRCQHRHRIDDVIPEIDGYSCGKIVEVTSNQSEIAEELSVDPDEAPSIAAAQQYCGKRGKITCRSVWGWLHVEFEDALPARWWTPYCLWVLDT